MKPFDRDDIPEEITAFVGHITDIRFPKQGQTSSVGVIETHAGRFALKRARGPLFSSWLSKEVRVLRALSQTNLPVPRVHSYVEQATQGQNWALFDFLEGETVRDVLLHERDMEKRQQTILEFGRILSQIHSTPCPAELMSDVPWLEEMLTQAKFNLNQYHVDGTVELLTMLTNRQPQPIKQTLIHGDFTVDNVLMNQGIVTGVIDWSGGSFGDPRYDVSLATRDRQDIFESSQDAKPFFQGYGESIISEEDFTYFNGLYEFF